MDFLAKNRLLEIKPDQLEMVRKDYNFEDPVRIKEAISILNEWIQKQSHFKKKDFNPHFIETSLVGCKGSVERAKVQLDKICTMRTLLPQYFGNYNVKTDFGNLTDAVCSVVLPRLTDDYCRIFLTKIYQAPRNSQVTDFFRSNIIQAEYLKIHDYVCGFRIIIDLSEVNIMDFVTKISPIELRHAMTIYIDGYGMRVKSIHVISPSKLIDTFVSLLKQVLSPKVGGRIHIHKTTDALYNVLPKRNLPKDYGGEERSLKELQAEWLNILSSEEHMNTIREMNAAATDENCRSRDKFTEQYAGMPGTFRLLSVD